MAELKGKTKALDWRLALQKNEQATRNVIIIFVLIYLVVGLIIDLYYYMNYAYPPQVDLQETLKNLVTLRLFPMATAIMMVVAVLSVFITFFFYKGLMLLGTEYSEVVPGHFGSQEEEQLYNVVEELKIAAGLHFMPKVYIINADYMNAFATGYSEKTALVAITRGLLEKLDRAELQAVMAHELSHVRHNDIRLTMTVALLSNLILIAIDILFRGILYGGRRNGKDNGLVTIIVILRFVLPILTMLLILYLSRTREYMADAGSVELTRDNEPLARALIKIHEDSAQNVNTYAKEYARTPHESLRRLAYLYDPEYAGMAGMQSLNNLFSTHPPLDKRLKALGFNLNANDQ